MEIRRISDQELFSQRAIIYMNLGNIGDFFSQQATLADQRLGENHSCALHRIEREINQLRCDLGHELQRQLRRSQDTSDFELLKALEGFQLEGRQGSIMNRR